MSAPAPAPAPASPSPAATTAPSSAATTAAPVTYRPAWRPLDRSLRRLFAACALVLVLIGATSAWLHREVLTRDAHPSGPFFFYGLGLGCLAFGLLSAVAALRYAPPTLTIRTDHILFGGLRIAYDDLAIGPIAPHGITRVDAFQLEYPDRRGAPLTYLLTAAQWPDLHALHAHLVSARRAALTRASSAS